MGAVASAIQRCAPNAPPQPPVGVPVAESAVQPQPESAWHGADRPPTHDSGALKLPTLGGGKDIGLAAGIMLLVNNITGPGVPQLSNLFVESGWLPPLLCILAVYLMTTLSASMYAEAMRHIPGNERFRGRVEYSTIVDYYFGRTWYRMAQVGLNGALQSLNIISVIQSAQVMDNAISAIFGSSCALNLTPFRNYLADNSGARTFVPGSDVAWSCIDTSTLDGGNGWGCHIVVTVGYVLTAGMAIPCGLFNLDDNMIVQKIAFVLTLGCWLVWIVASFTSMSGGCGPARHSPHLPAVGKGAGHCVCHSEVEAGCGLPRWVPDLFLLACARSSFGDGSVTNFTGASSLPAINSDPVLGSQAAVLGTILFNFGFVTTVPSWINEKEPSVRHPARLHLPPAVPRPCKRCGTPRVVSRTGPCVATAHRPHTQCALDVARSLARR